MISAVITAGGRGERFGSPLPKQFIEVRGKPILLWAVERIWACPKISELVVVVPEEFMEKAREILSQKELKLVAGGNHRQDSVFSGLKATSPQAKLILIHDGVRPFPSRELIERVIEGVEKYGSAVPGIPLKETVKEVEKRSGRILATIDREQLFLIQTPQGFAREIILRAHQRAQNLGFYTTDDAGLVEWLGEEVFLVEGEETNIKITTPFDLKLAEEIAQELEK